MLTIYHSNQLDLLKTLTAELMRRDPLDSIFSQEVIIVQSRGMAQWLQMQLAGDLGIAANIDFPFPTPFFDQLYQSVLFAQANRHSFNAESMTWKLLAILPKLIHQPVFSSLHHYFKQHTTETLAQDRRFYQLASRIARLFDEYLIHRAHWIVQWEQGKLVDGLDDSQIWQAALWRELIAYTQSLHQSTLHRANIYQQVIDKLSQPDFAATQICHLPKRIFIFGIASLPPAYLETLYALGKHIEVHLMFMNPCRWYWGDIVDDHLLGKLLQARWQHYDTHQTRPLLRHHLDSTIDAVKMQISQTNPLLASWGKLGRDNLFLLQQLTEKRDIEAFVDYEGNTLLTALQQSILDLDNPLVALQTDVELENSKAKKIISTHDASISFHACHSEQREVEVLYDYLLATLDENPDLTLRDCVVMVADIDRYVPYIQSVFGNAQANRYLPYTISDQRARHIDPIMQGFFNLLSLPQSRFKITDLFDLLEIPTLAKRFNLDPTQTKTLQNWVVDAGIRWGLISDNDAPHSWLFGLQRMLLGYTMRSEQGMWQGILPYDGATGLEAELIGQLAAFLTQITKWQSQLTEPKTIEAWRPLCIELLKDFFVFEPDNQSLLLFIESQWQQLMDEAQLANYSDPVSVIILHDAMQAKLEQNQVSHRFLVGKINFCTMMPMRSIPFKVVCLLGMNDGAYPRTSLSLGFDLISKNPQRGDRSRRDDDRYLFLEAILSAQQQLYISYIGRDIRDNSQRYPSVLVDELLDYLAQNYVIAGDEHLNVEQSAQKLKQHLTLFHSRMPFNVTNFMPLSRQQSYADEWLPAAKRQGEYIPFVSELSPLAIPEITVEDLKRFYHHPIRFLLSRRLDFYVAEIESPLPESETFSLDGLERYTLNQTILDQMMQDRDIQALYTQLSGSGKLPYGAYGEILFNSQQENMTLLADRIRNAMTPSLDNQEVNITLQYDLHCCVLQGWLTHIQQAGLLRWRASKLSVRDGISLWIDHLIYCILNPTQVDSQSRIYGRDESQWAFTFVEAHQAKEYLHTLIEGYQHGMNKPLFLPLRSAWNWLDAMCEFTDEGISFSSDPIKQKKAQNQFLTSWQGGFNINAECDDYYYRMFPTLTDALFHEMILSAEKYLLPMMQYRL